MYKNKNKNRNKSVKKPHNEQHQERGGGEKEDHVPRIQRVERVKSISRELTIIGQTRDNRWNQENVAIPECKWRGNQTVIIGALH